MYASVDRPVEGIHVVSVLLHGSCCSCFEQVFGEVASSSLAQAVGIIGRTTEGYSLRRPAEEVREIVRHVLDIGGPQIHIVLNYDIMCWFSGPFESLVRLKVEIKRICHRDRCVDQGSRRRIEFLSGGPVPSISDVKSRMVPFSGYDNGNAWHYLLSIDTASTSLDLWQFLVQDLSILPLGYP